jgi:hypothetical protein
MNFDFRLFCFQKKIVLLRDFEEHIFETVNWRGRARLLENEIHIFFVRCNAVAAFLVLQDEWDR